jgi:DNA invertase Pin-like site-specific DNA recombinase
MKPKVFSYSRFSRPEQAQGDSLRRQKALAEQYAKDHGLELDRSLKADEGLSAFSGANLKRGHLGVFIEKVRAGKVPRGSTLLVESLDRLSREDVLEAMPMFMNIIKLGVRVVTLCDNQSYDEASIRANPMSLMMSLLTFVRANEESGTKAKRLKAAWHNKRQGTGSVKLTSKCPAWLRLSADKTKFECIPDRVATVQQLFKLAKEGRGNSDLARMLNQQGVDPWGEGGRKAYVWHTSYIQKMLTNRAVLGEFQPHSKIDGRRTPTGELISGYFPAIIPENEFTEVQYRRVARKSSGGRRAWDADNSEFRIANLFTHFGYCGRCGAPLHYVNKGKGRKGGSYLLCARAIRGADCKYRSVRYARFEQVVLTYLRELDWGRLSATARQDENELAAIRVQMESFSAQISKNKKTIVLMVEGMADSGAKPQAIIAKIGELEEQNAAHEAELKLLSGKYQTKSSSLENAQSHGAFLRQSISDGEQAGRVNDPTVRAALRDQLKFLVTRLELITDPEWSEVEEHYGNGGGLPATSLLFPHGQKSRLFISIEFAMGAKRWLLLSKESEVAQEVIQAARNLTHTLKRPEGVSPCPV